MNIPGKDIQLHTFEGGIDSDTSPESMLPNRARYMLNVRGHTNGQKGVITNVKGNLLISTPLPAGINQPQGWGADEENNKFYFIVYNSNGYHTVYMYDDLKNSVTIVLQSRRDSNDVDILTLNKDYLINHVDIIDGKITWCDGYNKATKFNLAKAMDKSDAGYGVVIYKEYITAYKKSAVYAPTVVYTTDTTRNSNFLYGKLFKFAVRFIYDDGEESNWSDWSSVALPLNQSYSGLNNITYDNNCIQVTLETGNMLVKKLEVAMKVGSLDFVTTSILDKKTLQITDNGTYLFNFYNDGADVSTSQEKINRQYSLLPDKPFCQAFVKNAMTYTNFKEGFESVNIAIKVSVEYQDLFIPDGTVNQYNNPQILLELIGNGYTGNIGGYRYNAQWRFTIGFDVKAGNQFYLYGRDGGGYNYAFGYIATAADTAATVANNFKAQQRNTGRGYPVGNNGVSDESTDGSGNVSWVWTVFGNWKTSPISWTSKVVPVSFQSLRDDGTSVPLIKPGSTRKYAIAYEDDDGRKSLANTSDAAVINTGFITEVGDQKRAVHTIEISNKPPLWAKYYYLLRTIDSGPWIQMLIQRVIKVDPDPTLAAAGNNQKYLDLVVGSLFTYQKLHPNTILTYEFEKGDRLRLIKYYDGTNKVMYPYLETEILSYSINTIETVNQNIFVDGTAVVKINGTANPSYVGKMITINGYQRKIIGTTAGDKYQLDSPVADGTNTQSATFPTFIITDTRGILRIKQPQGIDVKDFSLVELYKPLLNNSVDGYKQFYPFGVKLGIGNYGTENAYHAGTEQNQYENSPSDPAIIKVLQGDAYYRNRELPTNDAVPGTQIQVDHVIDPNYSDFYESNLTSLGRVFAQDDGSGVKYFGSRTRFSNAFIQDTKINGMNDFDNGDREDYNDTNGDVQLTKFRENRLYYFKDLKTGWVPVSQTIISDNSDQSLLGTSSKLLGQMQYFLWKGGIGKNPESYVSNGNYQYFASANSGVFIRVAGDGCDPISKIYNYDKESRLILTAAAKQGLRIFGGFDRENSEVIFAIPAYNNYIFNGGFLESEWNVLNDQLPEGTTYEITQQPANSTVSLADDGMFQIETGTVLGEDYYVYRAKLADGSYLPARRECFSVVQSPNRQHGFKVRTNTKYCVVRNHGFQVRQSSKYCVVRDHGFQVRDSSKFCEVRSVGFRVRAASKYCLQTPTVPLGDFDFMVLRYLWESGAGVDLDTFTGFINTGTAYDGNPTTRAGWVGYGQNPNISTGEPDSGSRVIPYGSPTPYLNWGTDNTSGSGIEAILVDLKKFIVDNPGTPNPISVKMNTVWYSSVGTGDISVEVTTYKGGTMTFDVPTKNFINAGGVVVDTIELPYNVSLQNGLFIISSSQDTAQMDFDTTTNTATLTLK